MPQDYNNIRMKFKNRLKEQMGTEAGDAQPTASSGGPSTMEEVQRQLGHSDQSTTKGYVQEDETTVKRRLIESHIPLPLAPVDPVDKVVTAVKAQLAALDAKDLEKAKADLLTWLQQ